MQSRLLNPNTGKPITQVWRSLGTSDRRLAERLAVPIYNEILSEWRALAGGEQRSADLPALAVDRGYRLMLSRLEEDRRKQPADSAAYAEFLAKRQADLLKLTRRRQDGTQEHWEGVADRIIANEGLTLPKGSDGYQAFVESIADASIDALSVFNRRAAGELDAEPRSKLVREALNREANSAPAGETLLELFERYAAQRLAEKRKRPDTINQDRKVVENFAGFIGKDRKVSTITNVDVRDWIDTLAMLPPNFRKMLAYQKLDMREAARKAQAAGVKGPSHNTLNKYLSTVSPLFKWLTKRNYYSGANPCDGLFYDIPKGNNPRPPFSTEQLNAILSSPLFTGFQRDGKEHLPGNCQADDWRYWIPLVAMFTGARIGEIAQLRVEDVRKERGVWFIHIRADEETGQTTKSGHSRYAPVHSKLEGLGFLDFHKRQAERAERVGGASMFPELEPNERGQISGKPSRFWREYLEAIGLKDGRDGFGAHSFRHTMADRLRDEAEMLDDQIEVALGHNQKTTTSGYGRLRQGTVTMLRDMFEGVRFDGVNFTPIMPR
jgi:integrase